MSNLEIKNFINFLDIKSGDNIMMHGNISVINQLKFKKKLSIKKKLLIFIKKITTSISPTGNLLIPTFTYKFCKKKIIDLNNDISEVGMFSELSRKLNFGSRIIHPIFSFKIFGRENKYFKNSDQTTCFGKNSLFDRFNNTNGKIIFLGCDFEKMTFIHFIEENLKVKYRYKKIFKGKIKFKNETKNIKVNYYARKLNYKKNLNLQNLYNLLIKHEKIKYYDFGRYRINLVKTNDIEKYVYKKIKKNPDYLLQ